MAVMANKWRQDFPLIYRQTQGEHPLVYLDTGATSQKPQVVIDTLYDFYKSQYGTVNRAVYSLAAQATERYQAVRELTRSFLHAESVDEIIFTRGTTESINFIAYSFGKAFIQAGDEILIPEIEHHANIVPWQIMAEDRGAVIKVVPVNDQGELCLDSYKQLLGPRTKLVAIAHVSNSLGTIHPIKEIAQLAHENGSKILVDGAQAAPQIPVNVQELDADFYVFSPHKTYGPTGVGVLYGKKALLDQLPPPQGGGDMIDQVTFEKTTYATAPIKFEAGTPMIAQVIGMGAALRYLLDCGLDSIFTHEQELMHYATKQLLEIPGLRILGTAAQKAAIITFVIESAHHLDIGTLLDLRGVAIRTGHHCAQPAMARFGVTGACRVSFGLYNTLEDVDLFIGHLKAVLTMLKP